MTDIEAKRISQDLLAACTDIAADVIESYTGVRPLTRRTVLDETLPELTRREAQAAAFLDAMRVVRRWIPPGSQKTLGAALKTIPPDEAALIVSRLRAASGVR